MYHMLLVLLAGIWLNPIKNIRRKFNGYSGTCMVLLMFVCNFFFLGVWGWVRDGVIGILTLIFWRS